MFSSSVKTLLASKLPQAPEITAAPSLRHDYDELLASLQPPGRIAVVDDNDTAAALGDALCRALKTRYAVTRIGCGRTPAADGETVGRIRRQSQEAALLVAVGGGTISDLCKYASFLDNKPYVVFPTAASMNGYLSANASITLEGYKTTLPAHLPKAVFCDMGVVAAAPSRLAKSGLGDSLARATAQSDWLLSHLLLGTDYDDVSFALTEALEPEVFAQARGIAGGDRLCVENLLRLLLLSGLGMTVAGGSYPASQSEHMLAHAYEMLNPQAPHSLHGEQIGVTALTMAARQQRQLSQAPTLLPPAFPADGMAALFPPAIVENAQKAYAEKQQRIRQAGLGDASLAARWPDIAHRLERVMLTPAQVEHVLEQAEAPRRPAALGWEDEKYAQALTHARFMRERFTCLDIAA